ncbi:LysR substrate-binding domain-containing protein [Streptomyces sp. NPDC059851]|uniref:LysR substrate-binding domain-containing protein n=1 Tax=Streptomyces sp. NPDC059851 TaxID=3346971 RepID=UPI00365EFF8A
MERRGGRGDREAGHGVAPDHESGGRHTYGLLPRPLPPGCERRPLFDAPVHLVVHPADAADHGLRAGAAADLRLFARAPWLLPGTGTARHEMTHRACGAAGFVPRPLAAANGLTVLTALVARRAGVALAPGLALPSACPDLSIHPLAAPVHRRVRAAYHAGPGARPEIRRVRDDLADAAADATREGHAIAADQCRTGTPGSAAPPAPKLPAGRRRTGSGRVRALRVGWRWASRSHCSGVRGQTRRDGTCCRPASAAGPAGDVPPVAR